jgi:hypothetical protein
MNTTPHTTRHTTPRTKKQLSAYLAAEAAKREAELDNGKAPDLRLGKTRKQFQAAW